jgi:3-phenylpropionate/trans-cinnamate dioxygenase ferredoxin subunit
VRENRKGGTIPDVAEQNPSSRLVAIDELGESGVASVETAHGRLAVGIADGTPFAVSDRCRHLGASLGKGRVTEDGCLECPWHQSLYDVRTGEMTRGPQGAVFAVARGAVKSYTNLALKLKRYPVVERDGVLYLDE